MADDRLPIVFRGEERGKWFVLAAGLLMLGGGIALTLTVDPGVAREPLLAALVSGFGILLAALSAVSIRRRCPSLEINRDELIYTRCLQGVSRYAWSEIRGTEVVRSHVPREVGRDLELEGVMLVLTSGRKVALTHVGPPEEVCAAITRAAGRIA